MAFNNNEEDEILLMTILGFLGIIAILLFIVSVLS